jgi:hypothetical protein
MLDQIPSIILPTANMKNWSGKQIAPVSDLSSRRIYMEVGDVDAVVGANVMAQLAAQLSNFDTGSNVKYVTTIGAAHTFPTDFNGAGDNACDLSVSPFISNCGYDGAGAVLEWMYGSLAARNTGSLSGSLVSFAQTGAYGADGLSETGYLYVPEACQGGATTCKLHVALHGCGQSHDMIGSTFIDNTGYNMWAGKKNGLFCERHGRVGAYSLADESDTTTRYKQHHHPLPPSYRGQRVPHHLGRHGTGQPQRLF